MQILISFNYLNWRTSRKELWQDFPIFIAFYGLPILVWSQASGITKALNAVMDSRKAAIDAKKRFPIQQRKASVRSLKNMGTPAPSTLFDTIANKYRTVLRS